MKRRRGSSLIEFALALVVLTPVTMELAKLGATAWVLSEMQGLVREGAEFASRQPLGSGEPQPELLAAVRNVVLHGDPEGGGSPRIPGLRSDNIRVVVEQENGFPKSISVSIAGYEAPGSLFRLEQGPRASFPFRGRFSPF